MPSARVHSDAGRGAALAAEARRRWLPKPGLCAIEEGVLPAIFIVAVAQRSSTKKFPASVVDDFPSV